MASRRVGEVAFSKVEKCNAELFTLTYGAIVQQILKDYDTLHDLAKTLKTPTPMSAQATSLFRMLIAKGGGELDGTAVLKLFEQGDID